MRKLLLILASTAVLAGCAQVTPFRAPFERNFRADTTSDAVRDALTVATAANNWRILEARPGGMLVEYPAGESNYALKVRLRYGNTWLVADYAGSRNLREKAGCLDRRRPAGRQDLPKTPAVCLNAKASDWTITLLDDVAMILYR